jgi:RNA polymerase sigma factor (TIGR02999 family)
MGADDHAGPVAALTNPGAGARDVDLLAYLRLSARQSWDFGNRAQFFSLAARAMRRILVDYARRCRARKRPPRKAQVSLAALEATGSPFAQFAVDEDAERADFLLALDEALDELRAIEGRLALVVEYRFFVGLTEPETADLLGVTVRTVARDWVRARGWLYQRLGGERAAFQATRA